MRILYVCLDRGIPIGGTKGASIHVEELLTAFEAEGHETAVLARWVAERRAGRPIVLAHAPDLSRGRLLKTVRRDLSEMAAGPSFRRAVRDAIARFRPHVIYERYALFRTEGRMESRRTGIPLVLEVNAPLVEEERRFRTLALTRAALKAERRAWTEADLVVVPSSGMARRIQAAGQDRVQVVPNAVDPTVFHSIEGGGSVRRRLDLDGRFVVAFAGSLKRWHDLTTLIMAVAGLPAGVRASLLIVGEGPERADLERETAERDVDARFTGPVPHHDVPAYLAAADVGVASLAGDPSLDYFSPLKAMEYLACGVPTVVAEVGDLTELAGAGAALAYRPGDADALRDRLERLAEDPELRRRLSEVGPVLAAQRTWREAARSIAQALERLSRTASSA